MLDPPDLRLRLVRAARNDATVILALVAVFIATVNGLANLLLKGRYELLTVIIAVITLFFAIFWRSWGWPNT